MFSEFHMQLLFNLFIDRQPIDEARSEVLEDECIDEMYLLDRDLGGDNGT